MEPHEMEYLNMRSLQERPITLGELLLREEEEDMDTTPSRSMGRTMSPTRCMGSLANGRPRRARGRALMRPYGSDDQLDDDFNESHLYRQTRQLRRRAASGPLTIPALARWRNATAEARIRNFHSLMNRSRTTGRRGTSAGFRARQRSLERSDSPDLFFNPFSWQRRRFNSAISRRTRSRSATYAGSRSRSRLPGRSYNHRTHSMMQEEQNMSSYRYLREGRPHSGRPDPESRRNATQTSGSAIPDPVRRFINFAAEFIPVQEQPEDAEPPEWSLNITAADFGPFAVGRSALSRARSLAIIGALSQVIEDPADAEQNPNGN